MIWGQAKDFLFGDMGGQVMDVLFNDMERGKLWMFYLLIWGGGQVKDISFNDMEGML